MAEWLVRVPSPVLLSTYAQQTAQRLDVPEEAVRQELRKLQGSRRQGQPIQSEQVAEEEFSEGEIDRTPNQPSELVLLQLMLSDVRVIDMVMERLDSEWLTNSIAGQLVQNILNLHRSGRWDGHQTLMNNETSDEETKLVAELMVKRPLSQGLEGAATDCLATMERVWAERQVHEIRKQLNRPDLEPSEREKLQRQFLDLQPKLRNIPRLSMRKP
jgi:DNA primase